jgi:hypothetical protein
MLCREVRDDKSIYLATHFGLFSEQAATNVPKLEGRMSAGCWLGRNKFVMHSAFDI